MTTDINAALRGVQVLRAFRSGDVVFIQASALLSNDQLNRLSDHFKKLLEPRGITAIVLSGDLYVTAASHMPLFNTPKMVWLLALLAGAAGGAATLGILLNLLKGLN